MLTTPRWGIRYPQGTGDSPDVPLWMSRMALDLDDHAKDTQGLLADRPTSTVASPGKAGRYYYATDTGIVYRDFGTGWIAVSAAPGDIEATARTTAPDGWLICDGSPVDRTTYALLFNAIGTNFGDGRGDGRTFSLPDLRGRVPVGADGVAGRLSVNDALGASSGSESHSHNAGSLAASAHSHTINAEANHQHGIVADGSHGHTISGSNLGTRQYPTGSGQQGAYLQNTSPATAPIDAAGTHSHGGATLPAGSHSHGGATQPAGASVTGTSASASSMPPYQVVNWKIKT